MSRSQTHLDDAERPTGITPRGFLGLARERGPDGAEAAEVTSARNGEDGVLHLDGVEVPRA